MNSPQFGLKTASVLAGLICLAHVLRLAAEIEVKIGVYHVALWPSALIVLIAGGLALWFWRLASPAPQPPAGN
jgi:hypothetical protein